MLRRWAFLRRRFGKVARHRTKKVSEKTLELNVGAELLNWLRGPLRLPNVYLRGLTQREEHREGVDFFAELAPSARIFAFQFKAPQGPSDRIPYRYTLQRQQHTALHALARRSRNSVFYVLPFFVSPLKLQYHVPSLLPETRFLRVAPMTPSRVFGGNKSKVVCCNSRTASVNPDYTLRTAQELELSRDSGIAPEQFAAWYAELRTPPDPNDDLPRQTSPWLVRGLRVAIVLSG